MLGRWVESYKSFGILVEGVEMGKQKQIPRCARNDNSPRENLDDLSVDDLRAKPRPKIFTTDQHR